MNELFQQWCLVTFKRILLFNLITLTLSSCYEVTDVEEVINQDMSGFNIEIDNSFSMTDMALVDQTMDQEDQENTDRSFQPSDLDPSNEDATVKLDQTLAIEDQMITDENPDISVEADSFLDAEVILPDSEVIEVDIGTVLMMDASVDMMTVVADCMGIVGGSAVLDVCNICSGGTSNHVANSDQDECEVCFGEGPKTWYHDGDRDGLGNPNIQVVVCDQPQGFVANALDERPDCATPQIDLCGICSGDDTGHVANSDMDECGVCFGHGRTTWYRDEDTDGLGNPNDSQSACDPLEGYVANANDEEPLCFTNDTDICGICAGNGQSCLDCARIPYGDASIDDCDICSGGTTNHDANSNKDECGICFGMGPQRWFEDGDQDGLGDPQVNRTACIQPLNFVDNQDDLQPNCTTNNEDVCGVCAGDGLSCLCDNSCPHDDGICDDGGLNARFSVCMYGTDCRDCGVRPIGDANQRICRGTCNTSGNGICEDGGLGSSRSICDYGTDCQDCDARYFDYNIDILCLNTCSTHHNGFCSDGGAGSVTNGCAFGTDCADCGPRDYVEEDPALCSNDCRWPRDGTCDDGGPNSSYSLCSFGSDCADCGARVFNPNDIPACSNSCRDDRDGYCDDGGINSATGICDFGTDCADCDARIDNAPPQDLEETLDCTVNSDCLEHERCEQGICRSNRCGVLSYDSLSPLGQEYIFYHDLEIGIIDEDRGGESAYDVSCYSAEPITANGQQRMVLQDIWRPSNEPMIDIAGGRFLDSEQEYFVIAYPNRSQVTVLSSPQRSVNVPLVPIGLSAADLDRDGTDEILVASEHAFATCQLNGSCSTWNFPDTVTIRDISAGDVDGDLRSEIVLLIHVNGVSSLYVHNVDGEESGQPESYQGQIRFSSQRLSVGDFNGDDRDEIAVLEVTVGVFGEEKVAVHELVPSLETGELIITRIFSEDTGHTRILDLAAGDLNADGEASLVLVDEADFIVFYELDLYNPNAHLQRQYEATMILSEDPKRIALADFDGDSPKATLMGSPSTVAGAEVPIAVLTLPPHDQELSSGHSSCGYGSSEVSSESFSDTLSMGVSADVGVKGSFLGLFDASYSAKVSRKVSQTLGESRSISTGVRTSINSRPSHFGTQYGAVVLSWGCFHAYQYRLNDPSQHINGTNNEDLIITVPVDSGTVLISNERYNSIAEEVGDLPLIEIPYEVGNVDSYPRIARTLNGRLLADQDLLFPGAGWYEVSDIGSTGWHFSIADRDTTGTSTSISMGASAKVTIAGISVGSGFDTTWGNGYRLTVGETASFSGGIPALSDDPDTLNDEYIQNFYRVRPVIYEALYTNENGDTSSYFVMTYVVD